MTTCYKNQSKAKSGGMSLLGVLLTVFVILKLTGLINWSWWWVLAPVWIPFSVVIVLWVVVSIVFAIFYNRMKQ